MDESKVEDVGPRAMQTKWAGGADYFADVGDVARVVAGLALTPFALLFTLGALVTPVAAVGIAFGGDWRTAAIVLGSALMDALLAAPLCWLAFRLLRGRKSANGVTVMPTWLVQGFLLCYLGPVSVAVAVGMGIAAYRAGVGGGWTLAVLLASGACGLAVGLIRAVPVAFRLGKRGNGDGGGLAPPAEQSGAGRHSAF